MKTLGQQLSFYHQYHQKLLTKLTHFIGVPLVVLSILLIFNWIDVGFVGTFHLRLSWFILVALTIYYIQLDRELGAITITWLAIFNIIAIVLARHGFSLESFKLFVIFFVLGWIFQLIGHFIEGKKPALLDNLFQIFIAPIFLTAEVAFMLGKKQDLLKNIVE